MAITHAFPSDVRLVTIATRQPDGLTLGTSKARRSGPIASRRICDSRCELYNPLEVRLNAAASHCTGRGMADLHAGWNILRAKFGNLRKQESADTPLTKRSMADSAPKNSYQQSSPRADSDYHCEASCGLTDARSDAVVRQRSNRYPDTSFQSTEETQLDKTSDASSV